MFKQITILFALILALAGLTALTADKVADKPADKSAVAADVAVTGLVSIAKADDGAVTVKLTVPATKDTKEVVYVVAQDEVGKTLVKMADKTVTATGTVADVKGVLTLTVKEVKVQEAKK